MSFKLYWHSSKLFKLAFLNVCEKTKEIIKILIIVAIFFGLTIFLRNFRMIKSLLILIETDMNLFWPQVYFFVNGYTVLKIWKKIFCHKMKLRTNIKKCRWKTFFKNPLAHFIWIKKTFAIFKDFIRCVQKCILVLRLDV